MEFRILGALDALQDNKSISLGGPKPRSVLAMLLLEANQPVSNDRLVVGLWSDDPPARATATVHVYVSKLRKALEPDRAAGDEPTMLLTHQVGYLLAVDPMQIDAMRFERMVGEAQSAMRRDDAREALVLLDDALALWRGPALVEFASEEFARPAAARLDDLRIVAIEDRVEARLALGDHAALVGELEALVGEHPFRERIWAQLMLALYRDDRQTEALRAYRRLRELLGEELGIEPSTSLRSLEEAMVLQNPDLDWTPPASAAASDVVDSGPSGAPTGTVTFLFTDLEGSTVLWEAYSDAMPDTLARHDEIVRTAVIDRHGHIVKMTGDGVHAVFVNAADAVDAALEAQRALRDELWGEVGEVRVRMGVHTGQADARGGDYFGTSVNKAARVMSVAHGGQVLVSLATAELVRDRLGDGVSLVDLGEHRLRDLSRAERLFQVNAPGLSEMFPPLRSLDVSRHNLPVQLTNFIGREFEIARVVEVVETKRLVTLTGVGGVGKTRLAIQVAAELLGRFPDGVWLVELAALNDPALVLSTIASSLGIREANARGAEFAAGGTSRGRPLDELVVEYLRSQRVLLILDNCEHLLDACASFVDCALRECEGLRIVATSREPLGVSGEATWRVPSLSVPDPSRLSAAERMSDFEAVRLFVDRAALRGGFAPNADDNAAIAQICYRLDGIPLAIVLAAARVKVLSPQAIAERLDDQFRLLTGGRRTALERHRTLRAALDWSYDLLSELEQVLLVRLAVFAGSFSLDAAEAICSDDTVPPAQVLDLLEHLVDRSQVEVEPTPSGVRYRLLESIRQYGHERLPTAGDPQTWRARHRDFFADFAANAQRGLWGPDQGRWVTVVRTDLENVRAAIDWSLDRNDNEAALRIVTALDSFWMGSVINSREGLLRLEQCLAAGVPAAPANLRARALGAISNLAQDLNRAHSAGLEALALYRQAGNARGTALVLTQLATILMTLGNAAEAEACSDEAVAASRDARFTPGLGGALNTKAWVAFLRGDLDGARAACDEVLATRELQLPFTVANVLAQTGFIAFADGDYDAADSWFHQAADLAFKHQLGAAHNAARGLAATALARGDHERALRLRANALEWHRDIGDTRPEEAFWPDVLAHIALAEQDPDRAEQLLRRGFEHEDLSTFWYFPAYLLDFASIALARGDPERAAVLLGASDALREHLGIKVVPLERPPPSRLAAVVRTKLGDDAFSANWKTGRALSRELAAAYALRREPPVSKSEMSSNTHD